MSNRLLCSVDQVGAKNVLVPFKKKKAAGARQTKRAKQSRMFGETVWNADKKPVKTKRTEKAVKKRRIGKL